MIRLPEIAERMAALRGARRYGLALAAGAAAGLSMPPIDLWPVLFLACPVFFWLLTGAESVRSAFALGWTFGLGYFAVCLYWVGAAFLVDAATYLWMMPFMVGALAGGMALYWGLAAGVAHAARWRGFSHLLVLAVALATAEWLRGRLFTGFPWTAPGLAVDGMGPVAQGAALVGMPGLTLLILVWAFLPGVAGFRRVTRGMMLGFFALMLPLPLLAIWGALRLAGAEDATVPGVQLRIVQPNIPQDDKWRAGNAETIFDKLIALSNAATAERPLGSAETTHLIWPESAVPFFIEESPGARDIIARMLPQRAALIMGALRQTRSGEERRVYNSVLVFDSAADIASRYDKWRLVPGGEFLPFEWILEPLGFRRLVTVPGSFTAGPGPVSLAIPFAPLAGILICYEAIFPNGLIDAARRPGWLINVTNDGWFGRTSGPYQHLAQARLRAIEQGLPLVRAANTGISAVIDPYGRVLASLPLGRDGVIDHALPSALAPATAYARTGDLALAALILTLLAATFGCRSRAFG